MHCGWSATSVEKFAVQLLSIAGTAAMLKAMTPGAAWQAAFLKLKLASAPDAISVGENPEITVAVFFAELDYFLLDRRRIRLGLAEHQPPRGRWIDAVRFYRKVMVVAHDKGHR
jgi:hypothetical protein